MSRKEFITIQYIVSFELDKRANSMRLFTTFITLLFVLGLQIGWGQVPRSITIQGVLTSDKYVNESYTVIKTTIHESASEPNFIFTQVDTVVIKRMVYLPSHLVKIRAFLHISCLTNSISFNSQ